MQERNQKIIDAIIEKANRDCPGSLALIGIYGSFQTGDIHEKSDLDLMILINDPKGYALSRTFIQDDAAIGHDLYCTTWEMLEQDSRFLHPHISKLMDARIVYCAGEAYLLRLEALRRQAMASDTREASENLLRQAEHHFALAMLADDLSELRVQAGGVIRNLLDAIALLNGRYFRLGTRRVFDEIDTMPRKPENLRELVNAIVCAGSEAEIKRALLELLRAVEALFVPPLPAPAVYPGTYEEMFSNWRNKMYLAAETGNRYLAFDSMCALDAMCKELGFSCNVLGNFDPNDLKKTAEGFDAVIEAYKQEYHKAGISVQRYPDIDAFLSDYLKKETAQ